MKQIIAAALLLSTPALASKPPEVLTLTVPGSTVGGVVERLAVDCTDTGGDVKARSDTAIVCARPVSFNGWVNQIGLYIYADYVVTEDANAATIHYVVTGQMAKGDGSNRVMGAASEERKSVTNRLRSIFPEAL